MQLFYIHVEQQSVLELPSILYWGSYRTLLTLGSVPGRLIIILLRTSHLSKIPNIFSIETRLKDHAPIFFIFKENVIVPLEEP